jgi:hypothetical protein
MRLRGGVKPGHFRGLASYPEEFRPQVLNRA